MATMPSPVPPPSAAGGRPFLLLVTMMPDDSGSISQAGNAPAIRRGHNAQIDDYIGQGRTDVLIRTRYLNGHELFGFRKPSEAVRMDEQNYNPGHSTPLYDQTYLVLEEVERAAAGYAAQFDVHTMIYILTDGEDSRSRDKTAEQVKAVVDRMFASGRHVIGGIGVDNGHTDFRLVFAEMGIPPQWIQILERTEADIGRGMERVTQTTRHTLDRATFRATVVGGFVPPWPPGHDQGTARPFGARTAPSPGTSDGPAAARSAEERGEVEREALLWTPYPHAFRLEPGSEKSGWSNAGVNPIRWSSKGSGGYYELPAPPEGQWYLVGRFRASWQDRIEEERGRRRVLEAIMQRSPVAFVPIDDKREGASPLSGTTVLVGTEAGFTRVFPLSDGITALNQGDPERDQEIPPAGLTFASGFQTLLRLAPGIVLRVT